MQFELVLAYDLFKFIAKLIHLIDIMYSLIKINFQFND